MKDVKKTQVERDNSKKRLRRRKRKMSLYTFIVVSLVLIAGASASYTFLFNINEIRVSGESDRYTAEQIVAASGIQKGDNLLRLNVKKSEQKILEELIYVETALVDRDFPSSLEIKVTKCVPSFNVQTEGGFLLVSTYGKILADNSFPTEGLPLFYGYDPKEPVPGKPLESEDEQKSEAFKELIERVGATGTELVTSIDMTDKHDILVNYTNGIVFKMGNWTDIPYKLDMAEHVMNEEGVSGKSGYITMIGKNQCSFRTSDSPSGGGIGTGEVYSPVKQPATDSNGMPLATAQVIMTTAPTEQSGSETQTQAVQGGSYGSAQGEINDEHQEMFDRFNQQQKPTTASAN